MPCTAAAEAVEEEGGGLGLTPGSLQEWDEQERNKISKYLLLLFLNQFWSLILFNLKISGLHMERLDSGTPLLVTTNHFQVSGFMQERGSEC